MSYPNAIANATAVPAGSPSSGRRQPGRDRTAGEEGEGNYSYCAARRCNWQEGCRYRKAAPGPQ